MNTILLIFFAIPVAIIIFSIVFQRIINCPLLVAAIVFAVFLVIAFLIPSSTILILIAGIIYAIIAFVTAHLTCIISHTHIFDKCCTNVNQDLVDAITASLRRSGCCNSDHDDDDCDCDCNCNSGCRCNNNNNLSTLNLLSNGNNTMNNSSNCGCSRGYRR